MPLIYKMFTPLLITILTALPTTLAIPATSVRITAAPTTTQHAGVSIGTVYTPGDSGIPAITTAPKPMAPADIVPGPPFVTITVENHHTAPVYTAHVLAAGAAEVVGGKPPDGAMARGATSEFAVPTGWEGMVAVVEDLPTNVIRGDESIIESNYKVPPDYTVAVLDVDVSYVDGFSVPIVCSCDGPGVVTGCNIDLSHTGRTCPIPNNQGSCANPLRDDQLATEAQDYFKPCQGAAYTFVKDHNANSFGVCQSGHITCCIGTDCWERP